MKNDTIAIDTDGEDLDYVRHLGGRLALVCDLSTCDDDLFPGDIVLLSHDPDQGGEPPSIEETLQRHLSVTDVDYRDEKDLHALEALFSSLGASCEVKFFPEEKHPGTLAVGHDDSFEPEALAEAIGVPQRYIWGRSFPPYPCSERNRPGKEYVTVSYGPGTVSAEYLGDCLARIAGVPPTGNEVFIGDVVRVSSEPTPSNVPSVTEVIYSPFPCLTQIRYEGEGNLVLLQTLFRTIGAACYPFGVAGPSGEGFAIVGHSGSIAPEALAHAAGFRQHDDKDDEDEDGEADEDADADQGEGEADAREQASVQGAAAAAARQQAPGSDQATVQGDVAVVAAQSQATFHVPLNQKLYARVAAVFGKPVTIKRGIPMEASYQTDPITDRPRLRIAQYGESYLIPCPYCNSGNLSIPHGFGEMDPVSNWPRVFLAKCFGKDCLKEKGKPMELHRKLFGYVNAQATI